jgi:protein subunit release factor B
MPDFPSILDDALRQRLISLGVRPDDVDERFIRGTGAGGQKINKTSSTVWLRHAPTGVEVRFQEGRSQTDNRLQAWTELCARLAARRATAQADVRSARELERRRHRQKSRTQKSITLDAKKLHAKRKESRRRDHGDW